MKENNYPHKEKLKHHNEISLLFEKGKWQSCGNLRVISYSAEDILLPRVGVSVSKKYYKKAVDRNRIKRLLREAYRLHKKEFLEKFGKNSLNMIFFVSPKKPRFYKELEEDFLKLLQK